MMPNSKAVGENINQLIARSCWVKTRANKAIKRAVSQGIAEEEEMFVLGKTASTHSKRRDLGRKGTGVL